jgi:hypothetical protein
MNGKIEGEFVGIGVLVQDLLLEPPFYRIIWMPLSLSFTGHE